MNSYQKISLSFIFLAFLFSGGFVFEIPFVSSENGDGTFFFNKNLKIGDNNGDVKNLQRILNKKSATEVSSSDFGSSGNETDFFGALTEKAVIKFQELYASEILYPFGLKSGTGFVGIATRLKLNSLIEKDEKNYSSVSTKNNPSSQIKSSFSGNAYKVVSNSEQDKKDTVSNSSSVSYSFSGTETNLVRVYNTSEYQISPGDSVILTGEGFTSSSNTIYFGENRPISNLSSGEEGSKISFVVPKDLPLGKYSIWAVNANGTSKSEAIKIYIVITDNPTERPVVEKVEPPEATIDSEMVVSGKGFTTSGNNIYSMFGNVMNLNSSDGKTIKFKVSSIQQIAKMNTEKSAKNMPIEVWFYVVNDNGYNKEPASFKI